MEYSLINTIEFWYLLGAVLVMVQMLMGGTMLIFFAGIAAFSIALSMKFELIALDSPIKQVGAFFGFSCLWSIILWKPVGYLMNLGKKKR